MPLISVAIAAFNVENYILATFRSIDRQSVDLSNIEFVIVDDGSTDGTLEMINSWAKGKPNVKVYSQNNQGVSGARQAALENSTGSWFTSVDPDDILDRDYFSNILRFIEKSDSKQVDMIVTNVISLNDSNGRLSNNHSLRHRFDRGNRVASLCMEPQNIQLGATALLRLPILKTKQINYNLEVRPTFEDAHLIARYLINFDDPQVAILADAKYYYRRRFNSSSLVQSSWSKIEKYSNVITHGYLNLLKSIDATGRPAPSWMQNMVLYDIFWYFLEDQKQFSRTSWLSDPSKRLFIELLNEVFTFISVETISDFNIYPIPEYVRQSILVKFKNIHLSLPSNVNDQNSPRLIKVYVAAEESISSFENSVCRSFFGQNFCREVTLLADDFQELSRKLGSERTFFYHDEFYYKSGIPYFNAPTEATAALVGKESFVRRFADKLFRFIQILEIRSLATNRSIAYILLNISKSISQRFGHYIKSIIARKRRIKQIRSAKSITSKSKYASAWCIMDRPSAADDNGEHLYRHIARAHPEINIFFVLTRSSKDWQRLSDEGFNLLEPGSNELGLAILNAKFLISSDAVYQCMYPVHKSLVDRSALRFVFLQHGVIMNDLSRWLNPKKIDLMLTTSRSEYDAIVGSTSPYTISPDRVRLTGLARYDRLAHKRSMVSVVDRSLVIIMPTWRHGLAQDLHACSTELEKREKFLESNFFRKWNSLVSGEDFVSMLNDSRSKAVFVPHPSLQPYMEFLNFPNHISVADLELNTIQDYLAASKILLTDYSSISFDAAYIDTPTVYYQFDKDEVFGGTHNFRPGYFDYEKHGFGPVSEDRHAVIEYLDSYLNGKHTLTEFKIRVNETFLYRDQKNCERIFDTLVSTEAGSSR